MNKMSCKFRSNIENEAFARTSALAFLMPLKPTMEEMMEIKTLISEAVSNAILHAYENNPEGMVKLEIAYDNNGLVTMIISDSGCGIADIQQAMQPLYTSKLENERSGMGMSIMQTFSDSFDVISTVNEGTSVIIQKQIQRVSKLQ